MKHDGWAIKGPDGEWLTTNYSIIPNIIKVWDKKGTAIRAARRMTRPHNSRTKHKPCPKPTWKQLYRRGYRCVKARLTEVTE
jgi:hypothetical protein